MNGSLRDRMPYDVSSGIEPVYRDMPGWASSNARGRLPAELDQYITMIEEAVGVPISIVSLGPDRAETIMRETASVR